MYKSIQAQELNVSNKEKRNVEPVYVLWSRKSGIDLVVHISVQDTETVELSGSVFGCLTLDNFL